MTEQRASKDRPQRVDKYMAFDLWAFEVVELHLFQLVFGRCSSIMAFPQSTFGAQV